MTWIQQLRKPKAAPRAAAGLARQLKMFIKLILMSNLYFFSSLSEKNILHISTYAMFCLGTLSMLVENRQYLPNEEPPLELHFLCHSACDTFKSVCLILLEGMY